MQITKGNLVMTKTEKELIEISKKIGALHSSASWYTAQVADFIDINYGRPIKELTLSELELIIDKCEK